MPAKVTIACDGGTQTQNDIGQPDNFRFDKI